MGDSGSLTGLQVEVAHVFFRQDASRGFLLAGGAALIANDLISRPTQDLDFFAAYPVTSVNRAQEDFVGALTSEGYEVRILQESASFCRMIVAKATEQVLVDLAIDSPPHSEPTITVLGPTFAPDELAARKLLALFGRAEARDFADVYVVVDRFGKDELLRGASQLDTGFDETVLAQMLSTMARFTDEEIPLPPGRVPHARAFFGAWAEDLR